MRISWSARVDWHRVRNSEGKRVHPIARGNAETPLAEFFLAPGEQQNDLNETGQQLHDHLIPDSTAFLNAFHVQVPSAWPQPGTKTGARSGGLVMPSGVELRIWSNVWAV